MKTARKRIPLREQLETERRRALLLKQCVEILDAENRALQRERAGKEAR
ncbi:hypothetical protein IMX07_00860 [bacterium]|nr:hypothetical protein [bacterium]